MGGVVSAPFKAVSKIVDPITSIASSLPVVGPLAGPVAGYITGGPLGAAKAIAGSALTGGYSGGGGGGGGGSSGGAPTYGATDASGALAAPPPGFTYGSNVYSYGGEPYDASKYFVKGNKGVYNVLPELGNMYSPEAQGAQGTSGFNAYQNIYNKMEGDTLAQQSFQKSFAPNMLNVNPTNNTYAPIGDFSAPQNLPSYLQEDIKSAYGEYQPQAQSSGAGYLPIQYADFGFGEKDRAYELAQFARKENNPFFQAFDKPYTPQPVATPTQAPNPYQPVESQQRGPAPRTNIPATTASMGTFRPVEASTATPTSVATARRPDEYKPVNIRTGGLASLRRKA
jgi:hypothetical protein